MPEQMAVVPLPKLGLTSRTATVDEWYVRPGDQVERGTPLCRVETEKTGVDVESPRAGTVVELCAAPGAMLAVGADLLRLQVAAGAPGPGAPGPAAPTAPKAPPLGASARWRREPLSPMRRAIAERMAQSHREAAAVTLTREVECSRAVAQLTRPVTLTDVAVRAVAVALAGHPALQARWEGDALLYPDATHVNLAVAVADGLVTPVLCHPAGLTLAELAAQRHTLVERARAGDLQPADLAGGTFTVSNLGMYGIDAFTPIINPPQSAVLGVGRIVRRPVAVGDEVAVRPTLVLSLTFDHRVVDGAQAAAFLGQVAALMEHPPADWF